MSWIKNNIVLVISLLCVAIPTIIVVYYHYKSEEINMACHNLCIESGYAAGERQDHFRHDVCACFKRVPTAPIRILLRNNIED